MANLDAATLKKEIEQQSRALRRIAYWIGVWVLFDSLGVLILYLSLRTDPKVWWAIVLGVIWMIVFVALTVLFGLGYHNGRRNVEKMLNVLERMLKEQTPGKKDHDPV